MRVYLLLLVFAMVHLRASSFRNQPAGQLKSNPAVQPRRPMARSRQSPAGEPKFVPRPTNRNKKRPGLDQNGNCLVIAQRKDGKVGLVAKTAREVNIAKVCDAAPPAIDSWFTRVTYLNTSVYKFADVAGPTAGSYTTGVLCVTSDALSYPLEYPNGTLWTITGNYKQYQLSGVVTGARFNVLQVSSADYEAAFYACNNVTQPKGKSNGNDDTRRKAKRSSPKFAQPVSGFWRFEVPYDEQNPEAEPYYVTPGISDLEIVRSAGELVIENVDRIEGNSKASRMRYGKAKEVQKRRRQRQ